MLKDIKIVIFFLCHPRAPGDSFEIGIAGCDLVAPIDREIPVEESVYPKFPRHRKEIFRVRDHVRSRTRSMLSRSRRRDGGYFTPSRAAVSVYEAECRGRKQFVRLGQAGKFRRSFASRTRKAASRITDCGARFGVRRKESDINLPRVDQPVSLRLRCLYPFHCYLRLTVEKVGRLSCAGISFTEKSRRVKDIPEIGPPH